MSVDPVTNPADVDETDPETAGANVDEQTDEAPQTSAVSAEIAPGVSLVSLDDPEHGQQQRFALTLGEGRIIDLPQARDYQLETFDVQA
jgi:hypothetical protein